MPRDLAYYRRCFTSLHTNTSKGRPAPHKALLLLAIIDMAERGEMAGSRVPLSDALVRAFNLQAKRYHPASDPHFKPVVTYPFYHMQTEPFWSLTPRLSLQSHPASLPGQTSQLPEAAEAAVDYHVAQALPAGVPPPTSLKGLRETFAYAKLDDELALLLHTSADARAILRTDLLTTYLTYPISLADLLPALLSLSSLALTLTG